MPSHPHPPHTQSDWWLLVVTCSVLQAFSFFGDHHEDVSGDFMAHTQKAPPPPHSCGLPHFSTCQAHSGQDT